MAPRKLSDSDKQSIAKVYCQPGETTSTLAKKFGVSSSTVSRVLKQLLSDDDYASLMQWKRSGERGRLELNLDFPLAESDDANGNLVEDDRQETLPPAEASQTDEIETTDDSDQAADRGQKESQPAAKAPPRRKSRRRSNAAAEKVLEEETDNEESAPEEAPAEVIQETASDASSGTTKREVPLPKKRQSKSQDDEEEESDVAAWVSEGLASENDYDADEDDDWDDEDWDDETDEDDEFVPQPPREEALSILSFEDFAVKKPCYLVVDRLAELITCPLKDFSELGLIPAEEEKARTLPVFDNHRVARRFARRNQRIIKVPNGLMLNKTQDYLQAKGITRLLFDGQVYALS